MSRFDYVKYDDAATMQQALVKSVVQDLEDCINRIGLDKFGASRSKDQALLKLEECYAWIGKAIRDNQINRNGAVPLNETRG